MYACAVSVLLLEADGFTVVGEAATGLDGQADRLKPRLVVLDVRLPDVDGFEVAARLAELAEPPSVVLVSSRDAVTYGSPTVAGTGVWIRGQERAVRCRAAPSSCLTGGGVCARPWWSWVRCSASFRSWWGSAGSVGEDALTLTACSSPQRKWRPGAGRAFQDRHRPKWTP
jgi:CheY-like chemotaxis protein